MLKGDVISDFWCTFILNTIGRLRLFNTEHLDCSKISFELRFPAPAVHHTMLFSEGSDEVTIAGRGICQTKDSPNWKEVTCLEIWSLSSCFIVNIKHILSQQPFKISINTLCPHYLKSIFIYLREITISPQNLQKRNYVLLYDCVLFSPGKTLLIKKKHFYTKC